MTCAPPSPPKPTGGQGAGHRHTSLRVCLRQSLSSPVPPVGCSTAFYPDGHTVQSAFSSHGMKLWLFGACPYPNRGLCSNQVVMEHSPSSLLWVQGFSPIR